MKQVASGVLSCFIYLNYFDLHMSAGDSN
uniref:Uncharacterized protein n=1 Tax=Arundo donax TaxID=35708 RepID=A0A0A8ZKX4_ARUDO